MAPKDQPKRRRQRADGALSRERILDAATEIAAERGYEGTSIALVSAKCGLPASSIYWHFKDKDDLIAAVIERSFAGWLKAWQVPDEGAADDRVVSMAMQIAKALLDSPDFIRLGLMLALERRPVEPRARAMFLQVRAQTRDQLAATLAELGPGLTDAQIDQLVTYAIAGADGLFIAKEIGGDAVDLIALFELHAHALYDTAARLLSERQPMTLTRNVIQETADLLYAAQTSRTPIGPLTERHPGLTVADAYAIQQVNLRRRLRDGRVLVGHKIGLTSESMQTLLGVDEPDFGHLLDDMVLANGSAVPAVQFLRAAGRARGRLPAPCAVAWTRGHGR